MERPIQAGHYGRNLAVDDGAAMERHLGKVGDRQEKTYADPHPLGGTADSREVTEGFVVPADGNFEGNRL